MRKRVHLSPLAACLLVAGTAAGWAQQELVFQDTFNTSGLTFDLSFEAGSRMTGSAGTPLYLDRPEHAPGGPADDATSAFDGKLVLLTSNQTWVSPDYNFIDGPSFTIEVDIDATSTNPDRTSIDWAALIFGASRPGMFVNASDGIGILIRNNGGYQVFNGSTPLYSSAEGEVLPEGEVKLRVEVTGTGFSGTAATIAFFANNQPLKVAADGGNTFTRGTGFRSNYITLLGYAEGGNQWTYTYDNLRITADTCAHFRTGAVVLREGAEAPTVTVKVPQKFVPASGSATLRVRSRNPAVAAPAGASNGELALTFSGTQPADLQKTFNLNLVGRGGAVLDLVADGVCLGAPLQVAVLSGHVRNPSFEDNTITAFPGYGPVNDWEGMSGVNVIGVNSGGPFHDNGAYPDRNQIGFKQGNGIVTQETQGLSAGESYWLQLRYNIRNCCGTFVQDMTVRFDGVELESIKGIQAVGGANGYHQRTFAFTPGGSSGFLEIESNGEGDHTLLLDAVTIVKRGSGQVNVHNPSFEASGLVPGSGVIAPGNISGWTGEGTYGVNLGGAGPYADNGLTPDQDNVAFLRGPSALSQTLIGLIPGRTYTVEFGANATAGTSPNLRVTAGDAVVLEEVLAPVGGGAAYAARKGTFVAAGSSAVLRFAQTREGEDTALIDDVRVIGEAVNIPPIEVTPAAIELGAGMTGGTVTVRVPAVLTAEASATVTVTSDNPNVAVPAGASGATLTLNFPAGGELTQTFQVQGKARGSTVLRIANNQNVPVTRDQVAVVVSGSFVRNPSFESNFHPTFPGYGPIDAWDSEGGGNTGINNSSGPFHDNGLIPDRNQIALLQTTKTIRQEIVGLTPGKEYWLQFAYNTRNCCGGVINLTAQFAGNPLATFDALTPVGVSNAYNQASIAFVPATSSGLLEFVAVAEGDATALLDGVTIVQRDPGGITVINPSFEASGRVAFPGYVADPAGLAGWTGFGGGRGVNTSGVGPFADNGTNPDQDSVAFLQGAGTGLRQTISGLNPGTSYIVSVAANARSGNSPRLRISAAGTVLTETPVSPVGGTAPYTRVEASFVAASDTAEIAFEQTAEGDQTVVLDDVVVKPGTVVARPMLSIQRGAGTTLRITWPSSATGYVLQSTEAVGAAWNDSTAAVIVDGANNLVIEAAPQGTRLYRLIRR